MRVVVVPIARWIRAVEASTRPSAGCNRRARRRRLLSETDGRTGLALDSPAGHEYLGPDLHQLVGVLKIKEKLLPLVKKGPVAQSEKVKIPSRVPNFCFL